MATPIPGNRAALDVCEAAAATGGRIVRAGGGQVVCGVTTDSRAVTPACAFVALRGERHDGHAYVAAAIEAGATLVIVEHGRAPKESGGAATVEVDDTLVAWGAIARAHLRTWRKDDAKKVVAITGSAGKTTTKELCAALLSNVGACHKSAGNLNNRVGVPAVLLQVEPRHRFVVLEMGMSVTGEIAALGAIAEPDVGVITNVGLAHAEGVGGTVDDVAREKGALFEAVRPGGVLVANADDPAVLRQLARAPSARVVTFGATDQAAYRLVSREPSGAEGSSVVVRRPGGHAATFRVPLTGAAAAIDFVAALAAAEAAAGAPLDDTGVERALGGVRPLAGRMHARPLGKGVLVLDDAYNASPATMHAALATLAEVARQGGRRQVAVLGEMRELGPAAQHEHDLLGAAVADAGVALVVSCGGLADVTAREAGRRGVAVALARDADQASFIATERVRPGDVVLVKASRRVGAERVVDALVRAYGSVDGASAAPAAARSKPDGASAAPAAARSKPGPGQR